MANMIRETFHGMIPATTPKGCFSVKVTIPGVFKLEVPWIWSPIVACDAKIPEHPMISKRERPNVLEDN